MPFDSAPTTTAAKPIALLRGREALAYLADALDAPMPKGFIWSYGDLSTKLLCGTIGCAIGLANAIWPEAKLVPYRDHVFNVLHSAANFFEISSAQSEAIFCLPATYDCESFEEVTPQMVAEVIRSFLRDKRA